MTDMECPLHQLEVATEAGECADCGVVLHSAAGPVAASAKRPLYMTAMRMN